MIKKGLSSQDSRALNANQKVIIDFTDLNTQAGLTKTLNLLTGLGARWAVLNAFFVVTTPFVSATATSLTFQMGWDTTGADPDGLIEAAQIQQGVGGAVISGDATGVVFAAKRTGFFPQGPVNLTALFTSITGNLSTFTAGRMEVFLEVFNLNKYTDA